MKKYRKLPQPANKADSLETMSTRKEDLSRSGPSEYIRTFGVYTPFYVKSQQITDRICLSKIMSV